MSLQVPCASICRVTCNDSSVIPTHPLGQTRALQFIFIVVWGSHSPGHVATTLITNIENVPEGVFIDTSFLTNIVSIE